jgi:ABC-type Fe3+-hydroxamate transport system substrate-binding protein
MHKNGQKIVSLVPSWTETLLECGFHVTGRTRFCIHPESQVKNIPVVGGTKTLKTEELLKLSPDVVILDKEENKKEMAEELWKHGIQTEVSHVENIKSAALFMQKLAQEFKSEKLAKAAEDYLILDAQKFSKQKFIENAVINTNAEIDFDNLSYVIWKNPWMVIGEDTFIADVLQHFGIRLKVFEGASKYPQVSEEELKKTYGLYSSEPYPFEKEFVSLTAAGFKGAHVNGEKISWYGIRNLRFLESCSAFEK